MKKLKRPDGWVVEEFVTSSSHCFEDGEFKYHVNDASSGEYTGIFWFEYKNGKNSKKYTEKTAPKWLQALRDEAHRSD